MLKMLSETLSAEQRKVLEDYLKLVEGNLPLNQLYVDLNNEEQINVRKENNADADCITLRQHGTFVF